MNLRDVDRRFAVGARKWVWSTRPRYVFCEDGSERPELQPLDELPDQDPEDEAGWWTCDPKTAPGDLAVIYRSSGNQDPEFPVRGPKDLAYVALATSAAFPLDQDLFAVEEGLEDNHGCRLAVVARIDPPVTLAELRADPTLREWSALKASFVRSAMPMPDPVWQRFVELASGDRLPSPLRQARQAEDRRYERPLRPLRVEARRSLRHRPLLERRKSEHALEEWLARHLHVLRRHGLDLELVARQVYCVGHDGTIDLLCLRAGKRSEYVVLELKVDEVRRDAVGQVLGYLGWLRGQPEVSRADAVLIGGRLHTQVPYAINAVDDQVQWIAWGDIDLPGDLRKLLAD